MAQLNDQSPVTLNGEFNVKYYIGTGTAKLQFRDGNQAWVDVPSSSSSSSTAKVMKVSGNIQAVLTGDAVCYVDEIA